MVYMDSTGRGTVMNASKVFFDFNHHVWQDKKSIPSVGMFVEFRAEGKGITSLKPSKFQTFKESDFLSEQDFWKSNDDNELEDLQNSRRSAYITQLFRSTDFDTIEKIPLSLTVPQVISKYFAEEMLAVNALELDSKEAESAPCVLDYFVIKRFLNKAYDTLIFMDNFIDRAEFTHIKNITKHLENFYNDMKDKEKIINVSKIFNEHFLSLQCHYQALVSSIDTRKNRLLSCASQLKNLHLELKFEQSKSKSNKDKIQKKQEKAFELEKEITYYKQSLERLEGLRKEFYDKNFALFENAFKITQEKLFQKIISGLNLCATILDMKIYHCALKSTGVKNSYFSRINMEYAFCSLAFAQLYLSRLDKSSLSANDRKLHLYLEDVLKHFGKKVLVVTGDQSVLTKLKIEIYGLSPYCIIKHAPKKVNYQGLMRDNSFDVVYIDEKNVWQNVADIILEGKAFDKIGKTKFKTI